MNIFRGVDTLEWGLGASWKRNSVILDNIANNDTPNFKASEVNFEAMFRNALQDDDTFKLKKTRPTHMDIGGSTDLSDVEGFVVQREDTTQRMDGNNVDIDREMSDFAKNVIFYNTLLRKVSGQFTQLRTAIKG